MTTQRTLSGLLALLTDNTVGNIGAEDVRDIVETLRNGYGVIYILAPIETVITDSVSYFPGAGTYTLGIADNWEMSINGRLRYIGNSPRTVQAINTWSATAAGNNKLVNFGISKNGIICPESIIHRKIGTGSDVGAGPSHALVTVANGDYLDFRVKNTTDTTNVTLETSNLIVVDIVK